MKKRWIITLALVALCGMAQANIVYIDFGGHFSSVASSYGAAYGVTGSWNTVTAASALNLTDSAGLATDVDLQISSSGTLNLDGWTTVVTQEGLKQLVNDNFYVNSSASWTVSLSSLSSGTYDVYVYAPANLNIDGTGAFTVNGTAVSSIRGSESNSLIEGVNYAKIQNITVSGGTLTLNSPADYISGNAYGLAGIQVVQTAIPEPASILMIGFGGLLITGYRRMRKSYGHF
ncbi:MAG: PEP-CTERM sorting domain-containing protein [Kiritimatiellales bacterium]